MELSFFFLGDTSMELLAMKKHLFFFYFLKYYLIFEGSEVNASHK